VTLAWGWDILQRHANEQKALCFKATGTKKRLDAMRDRRGLCLKSRRWACWCAYVQAALREDLEQTLEASRLEFQCALAHAQQSACTVLEDTNGRYIEALDRRRRLLVKRVLLATWQEVVCHRERQAALKHAGGLRLLRFIDALARGQHTRMKQEAFLAVRCASVQRRGRRAMMCRLSRLMHIRIKAAVWREWLAHFAVTAKIRRRLERKSLVQAFLSWNSTRSMVASQRHRIRNLGARLSQRNVMMAWSTWISKIAYLQHVRHIVKGTLHRLLTHRWTLWHSWYLKQKRQHKLVSLCLNRQALEHHEGSLHAWKHHVQRRLSKAWMMRMGDRMGRRHGRLMRLLPAFADLQDHTRMVKRLRYRVRKAKILRSRRLLESGMRQLVEEMHRSRRLRHAAGTVARRLERSEAIVIARWWAALRRGRRWRKGKTMESQRAMKDSWRRWEWELWKSKRTMAVDKRGVGRWMRRVLRQTWTCWYGFQAEQKRGKALSSRATRMRVFLQGKRRVASALKTWSSNADEYASQRNCIGRFAWRLNCRAAGAVWKLWHEKILIFTHQRSVLDQVIRRIVPAVAATVFAQWHKQTILLKRQADVLARVLYRTRHECVALGFDCWNSQAKTFLKQRNLMSRIVQHVQKRNVVVALAIWQCNVAGAVAERAEEERRKAVMQRVVKRMQHATLASGLLRWRGQVRELRRRQGMIIILRKVASRMWNAMVYKAFARWGERSKEVRRQRWLMQRVALQMKSTGMVAAFARWRENIQKKKAMKTKSTRALMRVTKQALMRCLGAWNQLTEEEVQKRQKIVGRMLHRSLSIVRFAMGLWQLNWKAFEQEQAALKLLSRLRYRKLILRWDFWHAAAWDRKRVRSTVSLAAQRVMRRSIDDNFQRWRSQAGEKATKLKIKASQFLLLHNSMAESCWQQRVVSRAWLEAWSLQVIVKIQTRRRLAKAATKIRKQHTSAALSAGLGQWLGVVIAHKHARRQDAQVHLTLSKCRRRYLRVFISAWHANMRKEDRRRVMMDAAINRLVSKRTKQVLAKSVCKWSSELEVESLQREMVCALIMTSIIRRALVRALRTWKRAVSFLPAFARAVERSHSIISLLHLNLLLFRRRVLVAMFHKWRSLFLFFLRIEARLVGMQRRRGFNLLRAHMWIWTCEIMETRRLTSIEVGGAHRQCSLARDYLIRWTEYLSQPHEAEGRKLWLKMTLSTSLFRSKLQHEDLNVVHSRNVIHLQAFLAWKLELEAQSHKALFLHRAGARLVAVSLRRSVRRWIEMQMLKRRQRSAVLRCHELYCRRYRRTLDSAFQCWSAHAETTLLLAKRLAKSQARQLRSFSLRLVRSWSAEMRERRIKTQQLWLCDSRRRLVILQRLREALGKLKVYVCVRICNKVLVRWRNRRWLLSFLRFWGDWTKERETWDLDSSDNTAPTVTSPDYVPSALITRLALC